MAGAWQQEEEAQRRPGEGVNLGTSSLGAVTKH